MHEMTLELSSFSWSSIRQPAGIEHTKEEILDWILSSKGPTTLHHEDRLCDVLLGEWNV